jgi:hypothetical protein
MPQNHTILRTWASKSSSDQVAFVELKDNTTNMITVFSAGSSEYGLLGQGIQSTIKFKPMSYKAKETQFKEIQVSIKGAMALD